MSADVFHPMPAQDDDQSASYVLGTIQPDVGATPTDGAPPASHPELSASHRDARLLKVAAAEAPGGGYSSPGHDANANDPEDRTSAAFAPSAALILREKRK